jgi:hypothetical protein
VSTCVPLTQAQAEKFTRILQRKYYFATSRHFRQIAQGRVIILDVSAGQGPAHYLRGVTGNLDYRYTRSGKLVAERVIKRPGSLDQIVTKLRVKAEDEASSEENEAEVEVD